MADNSAIDFVQPDLVAVFHRMGFLSSHNDIGMRFKDTDNLLLSWDGLFLNDTSFFGFVSSPVLPVG